MMNILKLSVLGVSIFICTFLCIDGNSDCKIISNAKHQVSAKDFKVSSIHNKYVMCGAYFCSHYPAVLPLQLIIHEINSTKDNLAIYLEKSTITTTSNCRICPDDTLQNVEEESVSCQSCPHLEPSKTVDIYVRLEKPSNFNESNDECTYNINFNMSVQEYTCENGLTTNIPQSNQCNSTVVSSSDLKCISPTCSKNIINKTNTDNFMHTFLQTNISEVCIWNLPLEPMKTVDITFSPIIKKHLTIFEDNLLNPKWNLRYCGDVKDHVNIKSAAKNILILYKNDRDLPIESFLQVNITRESCSFPSDIKNGIVDLKGFGNETVAHFMCFENYHLVGNEHISCNENKFEIPQCILDKEKLMADGPNYSTESVHSPQSIPFEGNLSLSVINPSRNPDTSSNKSLLNKQHSRAKERGEYSETESTRSNVSLIELDTGTSDSVKMATDFVTFTSAPVEGSGGRMEDEDGFSDMSDSDTGTPDTFSPDGNPDDSQELFNSSLSLNNSGPPWHSSEGGLVLFSLPSLEDKMMLLILIGVGILLFAIVTVTCLIVCRNRAIRSGLNRKFDTFQNPIYEKPVVSRVPIPRSDSDPSHEKLDLGDLSDSTVLD